MSQSWLDYGIVKLMGNVKMIKLIMFKKLKKNYINEVRTAILKILNNIKYLPARFAS